MKAVAEKQIGGARDAIWSMMKKEMEEARRDIVAGMGLAVDKVESAVKKDMSRKLEATYERAYDEEAAESSDKGGAHRGASVAPEPDASASKGAAGSAKGRWATAGAATRASHRFRVAPRPPRKLRARGGKRLRKAYSRGLEQLDAIGKKVDKANEKAADKAEELGLSETFDAMRMSLRERYVRSEQGLELPAWGSKGAARGHVATAWKTARMVMVLPQQMLVEHEKQLAYVLERLGKAEEPIEVASWQDTVDAWVALRDLLGKVQAGRAQVVLEAIFAEESVRDALGMGQALSGIKGSPPEELIIRLKSNLAGHIKANYYTYRRAIEAEIALIERIKEYKQRAFAIAGSMLLALLIAVGNFCGFIFSRYLMGDWAP
mmetsp:Transcript_39213/g.124932  ORF Transcript_39213/g.124932 Transcript_39213/m.124932 type:complete len:377 (+) Transcript_39213:474-1604(+)